VCCFGAPRALAEEESAWTLDTSFRGFRLQPEGDSPAEELDEGRFLTEFGDPEPIWISFATSGSLYPDGADLEGNLKLTKFVVPERLEVGAEVSTWRFVQPGDDAFGVSGGLVIRWHFIAREDWSLYADTGLSLLVASDLVPDRGTGFNFMPKLGIGGTWQPTEDPWRLFASLRWHHISNARIGGEVANPSRDQPLLQIGVEFPL